MITLGIETSCDETAVAICKNGKILSNIVSSQLIHSNYGGVVPEIASREHERLLNYVLHRSIKESRVDITDINLISVTNGPGLSGALLTGVSFAKGLALGLNIPIIPINHLEAHIFSNFLADPNLKYPFVCLLVSGGHTQLWHVEGFEKYELLGETRDDAAGEAFDKGARIFGLKYPGGPEIEKYAIGGNPKAHHFPRGLISNNSLEFSFSGLKTSLLYFMDNFQESRSIKRRDIIASYQQAIIDTLVEKMKRSIAKTKVRNCVIAGGVAANKCLRENLKKSITNVNLIYPELAHCNDNAAMIAFLGEKKSKNLDKKNLKFSINPNLKLS